MKCMHVHFYQLLFFLYDSYKDKHQFHKFWHNILQVFFLFTIVFPIFDVIEYSPRIIRSNSVNSNYLLNPSFSFTSAVLYNTAHNVISGKNLFVVFAIQLSFSQIITLLKNLFFSHFVFLNFAFSKVFSVILAIYVFQNYTIHVFNN